MAPHIALWLHVSFHPFLYAFIKCMAGRKYSWLVPLTAILVNMRLSPSSLLTSSTPFIPHQRLQVLSSCNSVTRHALMAACDSGASEQPQTAVRPRRMADERNCSARSSAPCASKGMLAAACLRFSASAKDCRCRAKRSTIGCVGVERFCLDWDMSRAGRLPHKV